MREPLSAADPWTGALWTAPRAWNASYGLRWRAVDAIARRAPRTGLCLAAAVAAGAHRAGWLGPRPDLLRPLLPEHTPAQHRGIARAVASRSAMTRCLGRLVAGGRRRGLGSIVTPEVPALAAAACEPGPTVLVSFHVGAWPALGLAVGTGQRPVLIVEQKSTVMTGDPQRVERVLVGSDTRLRARALVRAAERLRDGGAVLLLPDGGRRRPPPDDRVLGHPLTLAGGPAWLAARTGARLVPVVARWDGNLPGIALRFGAPLEAPALGGWLDAHLREHPEDLSVELVRWLRGHAGDA